MVSAEPDDPGKQAGAEPIKAFPCDKCGSCCENLQLFGKPYAWLLDESTGMCRYFNSESRLCAIYPVRPLICNMEVGYHIFFSHMSWREFVEKNMAACEALRKLPKHE